MKTGAAILGFVLCGGVGLAVGYSIGKQDGQGPTDAPAKMAKKAAPTPSDPGGDSDADHIRVPVGPAATKGPADALITIVEFSDFECPFCGRANPTIDQIQKTYGDKVRIAFKHNPLPFHKNAPLASEYAIAAGDQGKFWEMHDKLFENFRALQEDKLDGYAEEAGVDVPKLKAYLATGAAKKIIAEDQALAAKVGARGTPNFFVNGVQITGAQPFPNFQKVIDVELKKAEALVASGVAKADVYNKIMASARASAPPPKPREPQPQQPPATRQKVELVKNSPSKGGKAPLVTIVEWSDFECPFCSRANPTIKQVMDEYGDDVQVQFRHQPLSFHKNAEPAARAAWAAQQQGKFWPMHDKLFDNNKALNEDNYNAWAAELGLNVAKFKSDYASPAAAASVKADMEDGSKYGARGTPTFFVNGVPVRGAQPFGNFKTVIDTDIALAKKLIASGTPRTQIYKKIIDTEGGKAVAGAAPAGAPPKPVGPVKIDLGRAPLYGSKAAPVKLVVWSDFECPFCSRVNPSIEQVKKEYGDKVSVAFKHFPLPFHRNAEIAAVASIAAQKQGKFWQMHDKLFENQKALTRDSLVGYARELGLDVGKFEKELDDPANKEWVKADMAEGSKAGVSGTPATFVNGRLVSGAQPFSAFKALIDQELKGS